MAKTSERQERYWLRSSGLEYQEVTRQKFIQAERAAGFHPKREGIDTLATGGFSSSNGVDGDITYDGKEP